MTAEKIIHHYNRLNGNSISLVKLKEFRTMVQKYTDSNGHGTYMSDISGILSRVNKAIKKLIAENADGVERIELVPIDTKRTDGKILRVASGYNHEGPVPSGAESNVREIKISSIHTDTKRFQNRTDAFSEASANNVALHFDPNKFDPIVVWKDPANGKTYVLSGHSRYEGMKRRKSETIPVRFFEGTEQEAIKFARVEANRSANAENLIEDLAAYKLMRDGKEGVKPATKTELQRIFKGKSGKLEAYSHLNTGGLFVQALSQSNTSNYPYLERNAQWVGIIRNQYPVISNIGEDNIFHFFYSDKSGRNIKLSKDDFFALVKKKVNQLRKDESVLFPECSSDGCKQTVDREADPQKGEAFKRLREINEALENIREKLTSKDSTKRVATDEERKYLRATAEKLEEEKARINRDLDVIDKSQASLFGVKKKKKNFKPKSRGKLKGPQIDAFNVAPKKKHRGPLNPLQMAQLQDAIKAGRTPKVNLKAKMNAKQKPAPLFDEPVKDPAQASLFGAKKIRKSKKGLSGLAGADQLTNIKFFQHNLGPFQKEFHRLNSDSNVMIWGQPGHGKTVKLLQLAQHFASKGQNVLYVSNEEFGKSTLAEKIREFKIGHPNLSFAGELTEDHLDHFNVIFFDSVNSMGLTSADVKRLDRKYPNKLFFLIVQTTKEGDFRGGKDWEHIVDIAGEVRNRKLILRKNRLDKNYKAKADKLMIDELVEEQKQKQQIKKLVKEQTEPAEPVSM